MRVLKWIVERVRGRAHACESPLGWMPTYRDLDMRGINITEEQFKELMEVDRESWKQEVLAHEEFFERIYDRLPKEFHWMRQLLLSSLWRSPEHWELAPERPQEEPAKA